MKKKQLICLLLCALALAFALTACGGGGSGSEEASSEAATEAAEDAPAADGEEADAQDAASAEDPVLLYMGHASLRIVTGEGKVIYIDPYCGDGYDLPADLILVTHAHSDHTALDMIEERSDECSVITQKEALQDGSFDFGFVSVEAVEAGNNSYHDISECVGYILTFSNDKKVYVTGDTSKTDQMAELADREIDYAFFCCDGVYNMDLGEAAECAELVKAKHNIPYHMTPADNQEHFDAVRAEAFAAPDKMIVRPGEEITIN